MTNKVKSATGINLPKTVAVSAVKCNCSSVLGSFRKRNIALSHAEISNMRERVNHIKKHLESSFRDDELPTPWFALQGSYVMKTMIRKPNNEFDIDLGIYFHASDLQNEEGEPMCPMHARQMVMKELSRIRECNVMDHGKCVRLPFEKGYQIDIPVYRRVENGKEKRYEFASGCEWERTESKKVANWYDTVCNDRANRRQFRRLTHFLKKFAECHDSHNSKKISGFAISILLAEVFEFNFGRDDVALFNAMCGIYHRLMGNAVINHPVTKTPITSGKGDADVMHFRNCVENALTGLEPLLESECRRNEALVCWDSVFNTKFFSKPKSKEKK